jgi:hypothetical protein
MTPDEEKGKDLLPMKFWHMPETARCVLTTTQLRAVLLYHEGWIMAHGIIFNIVTRGLGAGVH